MEKEQIIKALECCEEKLLCDECPNEAETRCVGKTIRDALFLIREQEERIEELENICNSYALQYGTVTDKEVFLKKERADTVRKMVDKAKTVAYQSNDWSHGDHPTVVELDDLAEIAEELLEDEV